MMQRITTTIKRKWLDQIVAGTKKVEYREIKPYWEKRLSRITKPFELRLINGMDKKAPEATVLIDKISFALQASLPGHEMSMAYCLHIKKILNTKNIKMKTKKRVLGWK
jgi:hypothetical protein